MPIDHNIVFQPFKMSQQGIQGARQDRLLDLKERAMSEQDNSLGKIVERAAIKASSGQPLDQAEMAAVDAWSALKGGQTYVDPVTQQVITRPTLRDNLQKMGKLGDFMPTPGFNPDARNPNSIGALIGGPAPMDSQELPDLGSFPRMSQSQLDENIINAPNMDALRQRAVKVSGPLAGTPRAALMEAEADIKTQTDLAKETAKNEAGALSKIKNTGVTLDAFEQLKKAVGSAPSGLLQDFRATIENKGNVQNPKFAKGQGEFSVKKANAENMIRQTFRVVGSGATSDRDAQPFIEMLPNADDSAQVKEAKINATMEALRRQANTLAQQRGLPLPFQDEQAQAVPQVDAVDFMEYFK